MKSMFIIMLGLALLSYAGLSAAQNTGESVSQMNYSGKLYGIVESMPEKGYAGVWIINGRNVHVSTTTVIEEKHGRASAGAFAEVKGQQTGDIFTAFKIEIKQSKDFTQGAYPGKFYGTIEKLPEEGWQGVWIINSREILVTGHTKIEEKYGRVAVGALVKVEGNYSGDKFAAYEIEVKGEKRDREVTPSQGKASDIKPRDYAPHHERVFNSRLQGVIEAMPQAGYEGSWIIDGRKIKVDNKTLIDETGGKAAVGVFVRVKGIRSGETITAYEIEIDTKRK